MQIGSHGLHSLSVSDFQTLNLQPEHAIGLVIAATHLVYQRHQILIGSFQIATTSYAWGHFSPTDSHPDSLRNKVYPFVCGFTLGGTIGIILGIGQLLFQCPKSFASLWEKSGFTLGTLFMISKAMDTLEKKTLPKDQELSAMGNSTESSSDGDGEPLKNNSYDHAQFISAILSSSTYLMRFYPFFFV